jgi:NADH pyrophosphatase NudC (nudix superfamily)
MFFTIDPLLTRGLCDDCHRDLWSFQQFTATLPYGAAPITENNEHVVAFCRECGGPLEPMMIGLDEMLCTGCWQEHYETDPGGLDHDFDY